ncbi:MAG: DUF2330 domain-containing protein [Myxococcota bacterium]
MRRSPILAAALALALPLDPAPAAACGGFFCNNGLPVNQQAERIVFAKEPDGAVTAVIQISYEGPAERFAWLLPVAGAPDIAVSSNAAFDRLQQATNPRYTMTTEVVGRCEGDPVRDDLGLAIGAVDLGGTDLGRPASAPVTVIDEGSVGPYDVVLVRVDPGAEDRVEVAIAWLRDNGYDVPAVGAEVLRPYLEAEMNLLAFRLTKGNVTGAIRPVRLSFGRGLPSIPIRPTAVAAEPDMGVLVWVLGESRAVPSNYRSLELNEAYLDWFRPATSYEAVVTRAANEAGGQGFVTEMSGPARDLGEVIWPTVDATRWLRLRTNDWTGREGELLAFVGPFLELDGMREVLAATLEPPEGVEMDDLLACVSCYFSRRDADVPGLEPTRFLEAIGTQVVAPLQEAKALFERAAVQTRFYTTMSAGDMTVDPVFDFNADLGPVSNRHAARRVIECTPDVSRADAPWRVELASGDVVRGTGQAWPFDPARDGMPANARVARLGASGEGDVVEDNAQEIRSALAAHNATVPSALFRDSGACAAGPSGPAAGFGALALVFAALGLRRRRRL